MVSFTSIKITNEIKKTNVKELQDHWTFIVKDHSDHYIFGKTEQRLTNVHPNNALIMQQQLEMNLRDPQLVVRTNHQWLFIYVGENLIYKYSATDKQKEPGLLQTTVHLPKNYQQQKLRIITKTPYEYYAGIPARVFIGEAAEVNRFFILHSLPQLLLLVICSALIILMLGLLFLKPRVSRKDLVLSLILIGFIFLVGMQSIVLNIPASSLLSPSTLSILYNLTAILIPVFLTNYYLLRTKKYQHYYLYGVGSQIFLLAFGFLCILAGKLSLPIAVQIFSGFNVFMTLYTSAIALAESADQNRFYIICSPGIIMAAFIHCFFYIQLFAGAANLTTDWPLILFAGLMVLISGYHFEEGFRLIQHFRIKQQEETQQLLLMKEKQNNLLTTFKLLTEKEADRNEKTPNLTYLLQQMRDYYQKEFRKKAKFFSCQLAVRADTQLLNEENLYLLIQLFEKFLNESQFGSIDISIQQENDQLIIESNTSAFARHSFDESVTMAPPFDRHETLANAVKQSNGEWQWQTKEKKQYFKITLGL
ncbi:hypothetical protein IGI67_003241 [Enterococcus sp. AZ196]